MAHTDMYPNRKRPIPPPRPPGTPPLSWASLMALATATVMARHPALIKTYALRDDELTEAWDRATPAAVVEALAHAARRAAHYGAGRLGPHLVPDEWGHTHARRDADDAQRLLSMAVAESAGRGSALDAECARLAGQYGTAEDRVRLLRMWLCLAASAQPPA